jgi:methyl-accepting chemotaxis protein
MNDDMKAAELASTYIEQLPTGAFAIDDAGKVTSWNAQMLAITGYSAAEMKGKKAWTALLPQRGSTPIDEALSNGEAVERTLEIKHKQSGVTSQASFKAAPLFAPDQDDPIGAIATLGSAAPAASAHGLAHEQVVDALNKTQAVIEFALDGTILHANDLFLAAVGYSLSEVVGRHHRMFVDAKLAQESEYRDFWERLRRGEASSGVYRRVGKDGKEVWLQASYNPILDASGKPTKVVKFATDITEARLTNADYQGQIEAVSRAQAVIQFNLDGVILAANDNFLNAFGYTLGEVRGQHHRMFVDADSAQSTEYRQFWERLRRGEFLTGEFKRIGRGGKEIWIQASYNPIFDLSGRPFKVVKYATDVTQAKLKNADFQGQTEAISKAQAVIEFDLDGTILSANDNFLQLMGYSLAEVKGQHHRLFVDRQFAQSTEYKSFWEALRRGEHQTAEYKRVGKGGKEVYIRASYNPILDMNGRPFKVVKFALDVTAEALKKQQDEKDTLVYRDEVTRLISLCKEGHLSDRGRVDNLSSFYAPMMAGINEVIDALVRPFREAATVLEQLANQNLTARLTGQYNGEHAMIKDNLNATAASLDEAMSQVLQTASQLKTASAQISSGSQSLAQATNEQASSLEEVSSTVEQLSSMTTQNAANASQAKGLSDVAKKGAGKGKEAMTQLSNAIERIKGSADKTAKIVRTIDEIAFQTNLLALNAAVEAARAGDAGKGFAVVAEEVRSLAQRSAEAAKSTAELIEGSVKNAEVGVRLSEDVARQLEEIVVGSEKVNDIVAEIAAASGEQAKGIGQINSAVSEVNQITQQNAANSEQSAAAAEELSAQAGHLADMVGRFQISSPRPLATDGPASVQLTRSRPRAAASPAAGASNGRRPASKVIPLTEDELRDF